MPIKTSKKLVGYRFIFNESVHNISIAGVGDADKAKDLAVKLSNEKGATLYAVYETQEEVK